MSNGSERLDKISRVNALLAAQQGGVAFREGQGLGDCPYGQDSQTERFLAYYWSEGFTAAAPS